MKTGTRAALAMLVVSLAGGTNSPVVAAEKPVPAAQEEPSRTVSQIEVETHGRWRPTLVGKQREEAARAAVVAWFKAFAAKDLDAVVALSGVPFWMDGNLLDSEASLRADFKQQMGFVFEPKEFEVKEDFAQVARSTNYPMNGMLLRVSDGKSNMGVTVQFGKSVVVVGID